MFHRSRPGIQVRPVLDSGVATETADQAPAPAPTVDAPVQSSQPPVQHQAKEAESMSTFTTPNTYQNTETNTETATATQVPGTASYTQQTTRPMMRSPYAGYAPSYMGSSDNSQNVSTGRKLVVGEGITLSGEIESCDHLIVEGTIEATLKGASVLDISQTGMYYGTVDIGEANIAGRFEGDITVNGRLTLRSSGSIIGTISYKELVVEAGATIDGKISPLREGKVVAAPTEKKQQTAQAKGNKPGEAANELPFSAQRTATAAE